MSRLNELIRKLCPNGVEYKKLGEIATITRGGSFQKKDFTETGIPCIHYGQIYTRYKLFTNTTVSFLSETTAQKQKKAKTNDIIMAVTSENIEDVCKCVAWLGNEDVAISGHTAIIHHKQDAKYLSYYFHSSMFFAQKKTLAHGAKVIEVTPDKLNEIIVPVPPLEIQKEIVKILDEFTDYLYWLKNELEAEIVARKQQYEFIRDKQLTFSEETEVKWVQLGEVATIARGASPRPIKNFITEQDDGVSWIKIGDVSPASKYITSTKEKITAEGAKKSRRVKNGDFILSNSMSFGRPYIVRIDGCIHDGWLSISNFESTMSSDYLYYILTSSSIQREMAKRASFGGAVQNLNADIVRSILIPVPTLDKQDRIVTLLDQLDSLCKGICNELDAEIYARQKQYEYFRDKLLNFEESL